MSTFKFIHAADIHLDSPLRGLERYEGAPVDEIRGATRRALVRLVDFAIEQAVDFLLIAGDVYDGDWRDHNTGLFFVKQMSRLREAGIPVVMISGNHDAANKMTKSLRLPDNVVRLPHDRAATADHPRLRELDVAVHGRSFAKAAETENMVRDYPECVPGAFNIGLLHTSVDGAEGHEPYAPCSLDDLRGKEYDYFALGHVHTRAIRCDEPHIVFSGNLQSRHIREPGAKGCYLASVRKGRLETLEFQPLDVFRWATCEISAEECGASDELLQAFDRQVTKHISENAGLPLVLRVEIVGRSAAHERLHAERMRWIHELRSAALDSIGAQVFLEKVVLRTLPAVDADRSIDGPFAEFDRFIEEARDDEALRGEFSQIVAELQSKLPAELSAEFATLAAADRNDLARWLEETPAFLRGRLRKEATS